MAFNPENIQSFNFDDFKLEQGKLELNYSFDDNTSFTERWFFPEPYSNYSTTALKAALRILHLTAGISYFKAAVPSTITCSEDLDLFEASYFTKLYQFGLGEFAYINNLNVFDKIHFIPNCESSESTKLDLQKRYLVPIGGGKDSIVTLEILRKANLPISLIAVGEQAVFSEISAYSGLPLIRIKREIDPKLIELNRQGAYNGHVPISSILAAAFLVAGILYDYSTVLLSNENSSNEANTECFGRQINHQYSKSYEFELDFTTLLKNYFPGFKYLSFLRPLSELEIAKIFSRISGYDQIFSSCNANYKISGSKSKWCCDCPKCRFVFLILSVFMDRRRVENIFGKNLLDDLNQLTGYEELIGMQNFKPFECVGEINESIAAIKLVSAKTDFANSKVLLAINNKYPEIYSSEIPLVGNTYTHQLPEDLLKVLNEARRF